MSSWNSPDDNHYARRWMNSTFHPSNHPKTSFCNFEISRETSLFNDDELQLSVASHHSCHVSCAHFFSLFFSTPIPSAPFISVLKRRPLSIRATFLCAATFSVACGKVKSPRFFRGSCDDDREIFQRIISQNFNPEFVIFFISFRRLVTL